jgi:hypothetical protein
MEHCGMSDNPTNEIADAQLALESVIRDDEREKVMRRVFIEADIAIAQQDFFGWLGLCWLRKAGARAVLARLEGLQP